MSTNPPPLGPCPPRFVELKKQIAESFGPDFEERVTRAWREILNELKDATESIAKQGSDIVPSVNFADLDKMSEADMESIRRRGCVVIRDVVDDQEALSWREVMRAYVTQNPVNGFPEEDKQFFQLYWTKPQVLARAHPNVLAASVWLNKFYHAKNGFAEAAGDVDLNAPLSYADRFRMRHPGVQWNAHPPHVDGGAIERWEDPNFRSCFADILKGNWREHDPYDLVGRVNAKSSLYRRENQSTVFRTFQGWLAFSETAPNQGTLQVFPDVVLANAYIILRPFFSPVENPVGDPLDGDNWKFDISYADFPGIFSIGAAFTGPRPTPESHPHLRLERAMISVPKVNAGDMVFWHCDLIHAVELEHTGKEDSCGSFSVAYWLPARLTPSSWTTVMYIPAMPYTAQNAAYVSRQKEHFIKGIPPPDFPQWAGEGGFEGKAIADDVVDLGARRAMGLVSVA
ncbi:hypothetical protein NM688_g8015 [Phlebia brevispora]|uniref:Uncharacterized protein n=1 Tax=Phlebia brevispora TaxID=194682 RepID=A0ACC1RYN2_9APHY|nr:hypothetical protein NM688_g8015 [Phlebia brevispora]